jgi:cytochrome bd-type quinol oxidase subunit 2
MIAFVGWVLLTITPVQNLTLETDDEHDKKVANFARAWVFVAILILFASGVVGFILTLVDLTKYRKEYVWGALVSLFHPMLVIISAFCIFFGRIYGDQVKFGEDPNDYGFM